MCYLFFIGGFILWYRENKRLSVISILTDVIFVKKKKPLPLLCPLNFVYICLWVFYEFGNASVGEIVDLIAQTDV